MGLGHELEIAINGAKGKWEAEADLFTEEREVLDNSQLTVFAQGGDASVAEGAIRSGNLADFFGTVDVTNAVPLTFSARTLGGDRVNISDTAELKQIACGERPNPYNLTVELSTSTVVSRLGPTTGCPRHCHIPSAEWCTCAWPVAFICPFEGGPFGGIQPNQPLPREGAPFKRVQRR